MKCSKCKKTHFTIDIISCCDDCDQNSVYDPDIEEYITDMKIIDDKNLIRNSVEENGECNFGTAFGSGYYMFRCVNCGYKTNLPMMEGC